MALQVFVVVLLLRLQLLFAVVAAASAASAASTASAASAASTMLPRKRQSVARLRQKSQGQVSVSLNNFAVLCNLSVVAVAIAAFIIVVALLL